MPGGSLSTVDQGNVVTQIDPCDAMLQYIDDDQDEGDHINLYEKAMDTLVEKNTIDGEQPDWLKKAQMVFKWGKHFGMIVDKAQKGELADKLEDIIPYELINTMIVVDPSMLL